MIGEASFDVAKGLAQGGVVSPGLWNLHILPLARKTNDIFRGKPGRPRPFIVCSDDCLLIVYRRDPQEAQEVLDNCTKLATQSDSIYEVSDCNMVRGDNENTETLKLSN